MVEFRHKLCMILTLYSSEGSSLWDIGFLIRPCVDGDTSQEYATEECDFKHLPQFIDCIPMSLHKSRMVPTEKVDGFRQRMNHIWEGKRAIYIPNPQLPGPRSSQPTRPNAREDSHNGHALYGTVPQYLHLRILKFWNTVIYTYMYTYMSIYIYIYVYIHIYIYI